MIELRDTMAIFLKSAPWHINLSIVATGLWLLSVPAPAQALALSVPVGIQEIGKRLELKSTLSGIPEGAESQLRSTCLKSRIQSIDTRGSTSQSDVWVNFDPTIRQGGLIEFKSAAPINHALVQLELVSECPLVTFKHRWMLIMNQTQSNQPEPAATGGQSSELNKFDLGNSVLLARSRQQPVRKTEGFARAYEQVENKVAARDDDLPEPAPVKVSVPSEPEQSVSAPVELALLDPVLMDKGLIESRVERSPGYSDMGSMNSDFQGDAFSVRNLSYASGVLILSGLLFYFGWKRKGMGAGVGHNKWSPVSNRTAEPQFHEYKDVPDTESNFEAADTTAPINLEKTGHDRFLESLFSSDQNTFQDELNSAVFPDASESSESANRSALKISMELIGRADSKKWNLPESYQSLVEQRNQSVEQHRTTEALVLRSQIGLVELAFQDAKQHQATQAQAAHDLMLLVLGEHVYDAEAYPSLGVPDIVKSHVRAKMCEVVGADRRQLLRDNLLSLNTQITSSALCFHTDAWREFLSEEGLLS